MSSLAFFHDYYNRRASSGEIELYSDSMSSVNMSKSQSLDHIDSKGFQPRDHTMEFLEFSKTTNFRSRRDAVFEPLESPPQTHFNHSSGGAGSGKLMDATDEFGRPTTSPTTSMCENPKKRKATVDEVELEEAKKLKHG